MNPPAKTSAKGRRYGFACLVCRRRKIKCDGKKPHCANCAKAKEICSYKESPSFNINLLHQLHQSKQRVQDLESSLRGLLGVRAEDRDRRLEEIVRDLDDLSMAEPSPDQMTDVSQYENEIDKEPDNGKSPNFTVGEHGTVRLHRFVLCSSRSCLFAMQMHKETPH